MHKSHKPTRNNGFASRARWAFDVQWKQGRDVGQEEFAAEVVVRLPNGSVSQSKVSRWLSGQEPAFDEAIELASVLKVDPGWLVFGGKSAAPAPYGWQEPPLSAVEEVEPAGTDVRPGEDPRHAVLRFEATAKRAAKKAAARKASGTKRRHGRS